MDCCQLGHSLGLRGHRASTSLRWLGSSSLHRHHEAGSGFARHTLTYILHIPSLTQFSRRSLWVLFPTSLCGGIYFFCALPSAARLLRLPSVCSRPPPPTLSHTTPSHTAAFCVAGHGIWWHRRYFCVAGVALADIDVTFVLQAWHSRCFCVADVALYGLNDISFTPTLSHLTLSHTALWQTTLAHTALSHNSFTDNFVTHTTLFAHTHNIVTHNSFTHNSFAHSTFAHTHNIV
jgi:hypothetical protein